MTLPARQSKARDLEHNALPTTNDPHQSIPVHPPAQGSPIFDKTERHKMISEAAYFLHEHRGLGAGHELDDWLEAEREVDRHRL